MTQISRADEFDVQLRGSDPRWSSVYPERGLEAIVDLGGVGSATNLGVTVTGDAIQTRISGGAIPAFA